MKKIINKIKKKYLKNSFYSNSVILIINSLLNSGIGFIFWIIASRIFDSTTIGLATAIISSVTFLSAFSLLGFDDAIIRYFPSSKKKNEIITTSLFSTLFLGLVSSAIFLIFLNTFSKKLVFIKDNPVFVFIFVVSVLTWILYTLIDGIFTAQRKTHPILFKSVIYSVLKIVLLFPLVFLEQQGILLSWYASALISAFLLFVYLIKQVKYKVSFTDFVRTFKKLGVYSIFTYMGRFINGVPSMVLPLIIIETSSASFSAYYYIVIMIFSTLSIIPMSIARSCFAESSNKEHYLNKYLKTSFKFSYLVMIPLVILTIAFGKFILLLFGDEYAFYGYPLLVILSIVSLIAVIRFVLEIIFSVKKQLGKIVIKSLVYSASMVIAGYFLMEKYALVGIGIAFLISNITTVIALIIMNIKTLNELK